MHEYLVKYNTQGHKTGVTSIGIRWTRSQGDLSGVTILHFNTSQESRYRWKIWVLQLLRLRVLPQVPCWPDSRLV